jgi:hypothetical protein
MALASADHYRALPDETLAPRVAPFAPYPVVGAPMTWALLRAPAPTFHFVRTWS